MSYAVIVEVDKRERARFTMEDKEAMRDTYAETRDEVKEEAEEEEFTNRTYRVEAWDFTGDVPKLVAHVVLRGDRTISETKLKG